MPKVKNLDYTSLLCETLYALMKYKKMSCKVTFKYLNKNVIEFEGICGKNSKSSKNESEEIKNYNKIFGTIVIEEDSISIEFNNKYYEEFKLVQDYNTDQYYIINILGKIKSYEGIQDIDPIIVRKGSFDELMYSCDLTEQLKNGFSINWEYYDVNNLPKEDTYVIESVKSLKLKN